MQIQANSPDEYVAQLSNDRKVAISKLRKIILQNLPEGFVEVMAYGMIGYVVTHSLFPAGYHANPKEPLPFLNIASQKNHITVYHMGIYEIPDLLDWFVAEFPKHSEAKLDMGKSCIRFRKPEEIPFDLMGELAGKISASEWINLYRTHREQ